jgi:hypothetical protein
LAKYDIANASDEHVESLAFAIRRLRRGPRRTHHALTARDRQQAIAKTNALLRHLESPPRRPGATDDALRKLIALMDSMHAMVKLAASGFNAAPVLERLRCKSYGQEDLTSLLAALEAIPPGEGAARANAPYLSLLRGGVMVWEACGRKERYTLNEYVDPPSLDGPLPDLLRDLLELAGEQAPSDVVLHRHLRALKNL